MGVILKHYYRTFIQKHGFQLHEKDTTSGICTTVPILENTREKNFKMIHRVKLNEQTEHNHHRIFYTLFP
jgi:hypothetical protein